VNQYLVCSSKSWGEYVFHKQIKNYPGEWYFLPAQRYINWIEDYLYNTGINPRYIFFIHWSDKVPKTITDQYECIGFHPSPLPEGRGGTPVQNQIKDGYLFTELTAFRLTDEIDVGPIYLQEYLSLDGTAEEIYINMSELAADMIERIIEENIEPEIQTGFVSQYKRREPHESKINFNNVSGCSYLSYTLRDIYDHIRMLDAETYPRAFIELDGFRYTFSRPTLKVGKIVCDVEITENE
jgi:methionyl-tRNA formyltransferase